MGHEDGHEDCERAWPTAKQRSKLNKAWIGIGAVKQSPGMTRIDLNWMGVVWVVWVLWVGTWPYSSMRRKGLIGAWRIPDLLVQPWSCVIKRSRRTIMGSFVNLNKISSRIHQLIIKGSSNISINILMVSHHPLHHFTNQWPQATPNPHLPQVAFDADEQGEVQKVPAGATLYYDLELVRIIKPWGEPLRHPLRRCCRSGDFLGARLRLGEVETTWIMSGEKHFDENIYKHTCNTCTV